MKNSAREILAQAPVVPVLTIERLEQAVPLARALLEGGLPVLEVTLRTDAGLAAIEAIAKAVPDVVVGAGTVRNARDYQAARDAGSRFIVSPGTTPELLATQTAELPLIPGIATVSELMQAMDAGLDCLKFFPAEASGGAPVLKSFAGPFPELAFCPTGGVTLANIDSYLALPSVITVGGTWLSPSDLVQRQDWAGITELAQQARDRVLQLRSET